MMLMFAFISVLLSCLVAEQVFHFCDRQGSDFEWWFFNGYIAKKAATAILYSCGIIIASFGSFIELLTAMGWFGCVVVIHIIELCQDLMAK